jgi:hypothetical protein
MKYEENNSRRVLVMDQQEDIYLKAFTSPTKPLPRLIIYKYITDEKSTQSC